MDTATVTRYEAAVLTDVAMLDDEPYWGYEEAGRTAQRWGGSGANALGLAGAASLDAYRAVFRAGGSCDPGSGQRLVTTRRPGFLLVITVNKTVAVLDVLGRRDHVHAIVDAGTDAAMQWLDGWFRERGGTRGRAGLRTPTAGLTYAVTRTATSRAGDPSPEDHLLVANLVEMLDHTGGFKALSCAALRDNVEAATMVGRLASAARAIELGYDIEPTPGSKGQRPDWRIVGIPYRACTLFSKRSNHAATRFADADDASGRPNDGGADDTRARHPWFGAAAPRPHWHDELGASGLPLDEIAARLDHPSRHRWPAPRRLTRDDFEWIAADLLRNDGPVDRRDAFTRSRLIAEVAPRLYGYDPADLNTAVDDLLTLDQVVPLEPLGGAREPVYGLAHRYRRAKAA